MDKFTEPAPSRTRRPLLILLSSISMLAFIVVLIACIDARGHWWTLYYTLASRPDRSQRSFSLINMPRGVFFTTSRGKTLGFYPRACLGFARDDLHSSGWPDASRGNQLLGVRWGGYTHKWPEPYPSNRTTLHFILIPHIYLLLFATILPAWWVGIGRRAGWVPGFCRFCGYDLRATTERCPECGQVQDT
jgi:hypothetical protein